MPANETHKEWCARLLREGCRPDEWARLIEQSGYPMGSAPKLDRDWCDACDGHGQWIEGQRLKICPVCDGDRVLYAR